MHQGSRSRSIVEDICRFPAALEAIIAAKGAKVEHLDNREGRRRSRKTQPYEPPRIEAVEELMQARFERLDPAPAEPETNPLPPKKRPRVV